MAVGRRPLLAAALAVAGAASLLLPTGASAAPGGPRWAAPGAAAIHPGIATNTIGQVCTSNFVFLDDFGQAYLGQAAHCAAGEVPAETQGCTTATLPLGTPVGLGTSGQTGMLAYSSWLTMAAEHERDAATCLKNDFALVRLPKSALERTNPSVPGFGGPVGLRTNPMRTGEEVLTYGNSPLRAGLAVLSPKQGVSLGTGQDGWAHPVYTATPGIPGDSGSAFLDVEGRAFGVLSTLSLAPLPASNGVIDLARSLEYAVRHSNIPGLHLALGTAPFSPGIVAPAAHAAGAAVPAP
jgi:hypothetical protein